MLVTSTDLWALRYPATHELYVLARPTGGADGDRGLNAQSDRIHARSREVADRPSLIVASERMDGETGWRLLDSGELVHVDAALTVDSSRPFPLPTHLLGLAELDARAAASQHPKGSATG